VNTPEKRVKLNRKRLEAFFENALNQKRNLLYEHEAYDLLGLLGLDVPRYLLVKSASQLRKTIPGLLEMPGDKLVMKIVSPDILHKLDAGGVKILPAEPQALLQAYDDMLATVKNRRPDAKIEGVMVSEYVPFEYEILVSLINDEQFGPFISVGFGGTYTEIFEDIQLALTPAPRKYLRSMLRSLKSYPIFSGYRGLPAVSEDKLVEVLETINYLGAEFSRYGSSRFIIEEFEINPFAITKDERIVAIDSILRFSLLDGDYKGIETADTSNLGYFFSASTIAFIGATDTPGKIGTAIMENIIKHKSASIYPVNPNRNRVKGLKCYPSVKDIPVPVELAVIAIPAPLCPAAVRECAEKGVKSIVLITGGFREAGEEGARMEREILLAAREKGIRLVGPNCIGVYSAKENLNTFFLPEDRLKIPRTGNNNLVLLSQSGGIAINFTNILQNIGVRAIVSYGNMMDADASDFVRFFDSDPDTEVIFIYTEGFAGRGRKFYETLRSAKKPVIVLKGGKSRAGAAAARSHTGSMAGDYKRIQAALRQAGVIEAPSFQDALDYIKIFSLLGQKEIKGNNICIISNTGGLCILGADELEKTGLRLGKFAQNTLDKMEEFMEAYVKPNNPLDLGGGASDGIFTRAVSLVAADPNIDALCLFPTIEPAPINQDRLFDELTGIIQSTAKPVVVAFAQNEQRSGIINNLEKHRIPVYATPEQAVRALSVYIEFFTGK